MAGTVLLQIVDGPMKGKFRLDDEMICLIGRADDCIIKIPKETDDQVSRRHCQIQIKLPAVEIRDLKSQNGTFVNGLKLDSCRYDKTETRMGMSNAHPLKNGDKIRVGRTVFELKIES